MLGTFVLSEGYYDAFYGKAQKVRRVVRDETLKLLEHYDAILSPTSPVAAFKLGEKSNDPIQLYLADIFTVQANIVGMPAISIPFAANNAGLPYGLQLLCGPWQEEKLFSLAASIQ
jgi:aspartyl-tRNA(Asn)/glutamyl-tRNA(Gln) amidotransferase subunit A